MLSLSSAGRLFAISLFCGFISLAARPASLDIPRISGSIRAPAGYSFEQLELRLHWYCIEDSFMPMSPTGEQRCGGFGAKEGTQVIKIAADGHFDTRPIRVSRAGIARSPRFYVEYGLFANGKSLTNADSMYEWEEQFQRHLSTEKGANPAEQLARDLTHITIVRVQSVDLAVSVKARDGAAAPIDFTDLMTIHPQSYNFDCRVFLRLGDAEAACSTLRALSVTGSIVPVPEFDLPCFGLPGNLSATGTIRAAIGLVRQDRSDYVYFQQEAKTSARPLSMTPQLNATVPSDLLVGAPIVVDIATRPLPR